MTRTPCLGVLNKNDLSFWFSTQNEPFLSFCFSAGDFGRPYFGPTCPLSFVRVLVIHPSNSECLCISFRSATGGGRQMTTSKNSCRWSQAHAVDT